MMLHRRGTDGENTGGLLGTRNTTTVLILNCFLAVLLESHV